MHPSGRGPFGAEPHNGRGVVYLDGPRGSQVAKPAIDAVSRYMNRGGANLHGAFPTKALERFVERSGQNAEHPGRGR
jgi:selenocysteine lyase/cysteine desulfurase